MLHTLFCETVCLLRLGLLAVDGNQPLGERLVLRQTT